ncbi:MAG: hypothetical protein WEC39_01175 [Patescibacteria group bacterium]
MKVGDKLTVKSSRLEFHVTGTDRIVHYQDDVPFFEVTSSWEKAKEWLAKLESLTGDSNLAVYEILKVREFPQLLKRLVFETAWSYLDLRKLEDDVAAARNQVNMTGEFLPKAILKLREAQESVYDLKRILDERGIPFSK